MCTQSRQEQRCGACRRGGANSILCARSQEILKFLFAPPNHTLPGVGGEYWTVFLLRFMQAREETPDRAAPLQDRSNYIHFQAIPLPQPHQCNQKKCKCWQPLASMVYICICYDKRDRFMEENDGYYMRSSSIQSREKNT